MINNSILPMEVEENIIKINLTLLSKAEKENFYKALKENHFLKSLTMIYGSPEEDEAYLNSAITEHPSLTEFNVLWTTAITSELINKLFMMIPKTLIERVRLLNLFESWDFLKQIAFLLYKTPQINTFHIGSELDPSWWVPLFTQSVINNRNFRELSLQGYQLTEEAYQAISDTLVLNPFIKNIKLEFDKIPLGFKVVIRARNAENMALSKLRESDPAGFIYQLRTRYQQKKSEFQDDSHYPLLLKLEISLLAKEKNQICRLAEMVEHKISSWLKNDSNDSVEKSKLISPDPKYSPLSWIYENYVLREEPLSCKTSNFYGIVRSLKTSIK